MVLSYVAYHVDPAWDYDNTWKQEGADGDGIRGAAAHYNTMSLEEIALLPIGEWAPAEAHLYLWTTNSFLPDAFPIIKAWGFDYILPITWIKTPGIGMGNYYRNTTEHCLFAVRGGLKCLRKDVPTHIFTRQRKHSSKPPEIYETIESMSPGPRLDVFARTWHPGFDQWGDEVDTPAGMPTPDEVRQRTAALLEEAHAAS